MSDNALLSKISLSQTALQLLPYLSDIQPEDKKLVMKAIQTMRPTSKLYEDSWGYIIQATRNGGFKWYDPRTQSLIFFGRKSETDNTLVVPTYFANIEYFVYVLNRIIRATSDKKIIVKNVGTEEAITLMSYGFTQYSPEENWDDQTKFDDQTYPQLLLDLRKTLEAKGPNFRNLRSALRKSHDLTIRKYSKKDKDAVLDICLLKDKVSKYLFNKSALPYFSSHKMYPDADIDKYVIVDNKTSKIVGFTATSHISSYMTTLVAALFAPFKRGTSVWGMYHTFAKKYEEGYKFINLGGCEFKQTYQFNREKFRPIEEIGKMHLVYSL